MIIKGSSRAAPKRLAKHLLRGDTNERVEIIASDYTATQNLNEALLEMQALTAGTRGFKGLYHANIDPHGDYNMTEEQWFRAVDVLEEELGLQHQPRVVVKHQKNGREHLHVVWARTDIETMTLRSDSNTYMAHERASHRLEDEFGHEHVPGAHYKRDKTQERPVADFSHMEWQQMERSGLDPRERKAMLTGQYERS
ncbi:MAG: relaxase/mobilization nuclease domain-containing protein, partial [bacterium]|nr:relaxase/mobilization nuclease domain-containing protein [bacterium]